MTQHKILVEGMDGAGKSTLCKLIEERFDGNTFFAHWTAPPRELSLQEKIAYMNKVHEQGLKLSRTLKNHIIFDRFHISDLVYLPLFSGGENPSSWWYDHRLYQDGWKMVYVVASPHTIERRLRQRGDWFIKIEDVRDVYDKYSSVIGLSKIPTFIYHSDNHDEKVIAEQNEKLFKFLGI
jgi:thymidylate kinase